MAVYRKNGQIKTWMFWSDYIKLRKKRKEIKNNVIGFLRKYGAAVGRTYAVDWVLATFGIPPGFSIAVQVFIDTM